MSEGLGAGFAGLTLLSVLLGLAALLALCLFAVFVSRRLTDPVPRSITVLSVAVLGVVIAVAGFGVVALSDEAPRLAVLFGAIVLLPLTAVVASVHLTTDLPPTDTLATAGLAWSLPFVVGVVVTFGLSSGLGSVLGLPPAGPQRRALVWIATAVGAAVVVTGSIVLARPVSGFLSAADPS